MAVFRPLSAVLSLLLTLSVATEVDMAEPYHYSGPRTHDEVWSMYESWLVSHGKSHGSLREKRMRFGVFKDNLRFIDEHNGRGDVTYMLGLNRFADLTNEEYRTTYLGLKGMLPRRVGERYRAVEGEEVPSEVDWRKAGAVSNVKDQGACRSGWAFSTVAAVEGINQIVTGNLTTLSEQELVDCDLAVNRGCNGGNVDSAFEFIINNGGIATEDDYPYKGVDGTCGIARRNAQVVSIDSHEDVPQDEQSLKNAVSKRPVSVTIEGGGMAFQLYESGIFNGECGTDLDHAVTAIGYGVENGIEHWILKNSFGIHWGEGGFMRMARNVADTKEGKCGIAMQASYPIKTGQNPWGSLGFFSSDV